MSLIYWDTMLFIYWLEDHEEYGERVSQLRNRMQRRGDRLCTSALTVGELLVAPIKKLDRAVEVSIREFFESGVVEILSFEPGTALGYAQIRAASKVSSADAIHLACAAKRGVDLFLTHDRQLRNLIIPGIQFIDGLDTQVLGTTSSQF
jgi:predicted nucleic acid-binding protein